MLCSPLIIGIEFKDQKISNGKSPRATMQKTIVTSPTFAGESPKSKGVICGGTMADCISSILDRFNIRIIFA